MRPITDILREFRNGRVVAEASAQLAEVVRAVDETGKPGEVTIKIKVKPEKGGGSQKSLQAEVKSKRPGADMPDATFFSDSQGDLHRTDPAQKEMFTETGRTAGSA